MTDAGKARCMRCGGEISTHAMDAKPKRFAGPNGHTALDLKDADYRGEVFDWLECEGCYGPGFVQVIE